MHDHIGHSIDLNLEITYVYTYTYTFNLNLEIVALARVSILYDANIVAAGYQSTIIIFHTYCPNININISILSS